MLVAAAVLLVLYVTYWWTHRHLWIHGRNLPGPMWFPFIGNMGYSSNDGVKNFQLILGFIKTYGSICRAWVGPKLYVIMCDPDDIAHVLSNPRVRDSDPLFYKSQKIFVGNGSIALSGAEWTTRHKLVAPAFNRKLLLTYVPIFAANGSILEQSLMNVSGGPTIDAFKYIGKCSLSSIKESVLGEGPMAKNTVDVVRLSKSSALIASRYMQPWLLIDWIYTLTKDGKEVAANSKAINKLSEGIIAKKQDEYRRGIKRSGLITSSDKKINSFLDMMLEASESQGSPLSAEDLRDEVKNLIMTGTETTALAMSYFLLLIAIHSDVQDQIHQELDDIFDCDNQRLVTAEDLDKMVVLERAIKETIRLFPTVPHLLKALPEDIPIGNGRILPKDSIAVVSLYALHRNEKYFKDGYSFCPDRWLSSDASGKRHPYSHLPFGLGARSCPGRHYAMLQMKCTLSTVLRRLNVSTHLTMDVINNNLIAGNTLQLNPDIGYMVNVNQRNTVLSMYKI